MNAGRPSLTIAALTLTLLAPPVADSQSAKVARVGLLGLGSAETSPHFEALRQGLREHGYVEGQNLVVEDRSTVDTYTRLPDVAAELVRLKVDVIVTNGATAAQAVRKAMATLPVVMVTASDPVETGLAASLARPGGSVTGLLTLRPGPGRQAPRDTQGDPPRSLPRRRALES
jgi:ABC-type uncharacterized transport system substrate-binding protein